MRMADDGGLVQQLQPVGEAVESSNPVFLAGDVALFELPSCR
jgi:hypothetical protein